ncbi:unnamed protein product [Oreochromis niloticus]|nr:unnamed protein product [Mustela putorius furo]
MLSNRLLSLVSSNNRTIVGHLCEMSAVVSASLCWTLLSVCLLLVSADQRIITAEPGQTVILPCRAPNNDIIGVEWSRADLQPEHIFLHHDDTFDPVNERPYFDNRMDLQDRQMEDGDVSLVLQKVTSADTGVYECHVFMRGTDPRKRANPDGDPICIIQLRVNDAENRINV